MDFVQNLMENVNAQINCKNEFCTIIATINSFSNTVIHPPNEISPEYIDYEISNVKFKYHYPVRICANEEYDIKNHGYVSIMFRGEHLYAKNFELTCIVAVIDSEGTKRFLQSFSFCCDFSEIGNKAQNPKFVIDKYIARDTLLNDPRELLPNDILTLHMDIHLIQYFEFQYVLDVNERFVRKCFKIDEHPAGIKYSLFLDSLVAIRLREKSRYFEQISVIPMEEKRTRCMNIPEEEIQTFFDMGCILLGATSIAVDSVDNVFRLYAFADKYGIPFLTDTCRNMLKSCLSLVDLSEVSDLANIYKDDVLKKIVTNFQGKNVHKCEDGKYESDFAKEESLEWTCESVGRRSKSYLIFKQPLLVHFDENEDRALDFYR